MNPFQKPWTKAEFAHKVSWVARHARRHRRRHHRPAGALERRGDGDGAGAAGARGHATTCWRRRRPARRSSAPRWSARGCSAARRSGSRPSPRRSGSSPPTTWTRRHPRSRCRSPGFSRPVLNFQVALRDDPPLTEVFVAHLKSKLPTQINGEPWYDADPETYRDHRNALGGAISTIRRTAEATALRVLLTDVMKGTETPVHRARRPQRRPAQQHHQHPHRAAQLPGGRLPGRRGHRPLHRRRRCRSTATPATSTTPTSTRTCASRWTTCSSASSSTTTACGAGGSSTG